MAGCSTLVETSEDIDVCFALPLELLAYRSYTAAPVPGRLRPPAPPTAPTPDDEPYGGLSGHPWLLPGRPSWESLLYPDAAAASPDAASRKDGARATGELGVPPRLDRPPYPAVGLEGVERSDIGVPPPLLDDTPPCGIPAPIPGTLPHARMALLGGVDARAAPAVAPPSSPACLK